MTNNSNHPKVNYRPIHADTNPDGDWLVLPSCRDATIINSVIGLETIRRAWNDRILIYIEKLFDDNRLNNVLFGSCVK